MAQRDPWDAFSTPVASAPPGGSEALVPVTPGRGPAPQTETQAAIDNARLRQLEAEDEARRRQQAATGGIDSSVDQGRAAAFALRAERANSGWEGAGLDPDSMVGSYGAELFPRATAKLSSDQRNAQRSRERDFIAAVLRYESGAAIPDNEYANAYAIYFPSSDAGPEEIETKRRARANAIEGLRLGAGPAAARIEEAPVRPQEPGLAVDLIRDVGSAAMQTPQAAQPQTAQPELGGIPRLQPGERVQFGDEAEGPENAFTPEQQERIQAFIRTSPTPEQLDAFARGLTESQFPGGGVGISNAREILQYFENTGEVPPAFAPLPRPDVSNEVGPAQDPRIALARDAVTAANPYTNAVDQVANLVGGRETADALERGIGDPIGLADEIGAGVRTLANGDTYANNLRRERAIRDYDEENHPVARIVGQSFAALGLPTGVANNARNAAVAVIRAGGTRAEAVAAARAAGNAAIRRSAAEGAGFGAAYSAGSADGGIGDRLAQATVGALFGGSVGAAVRPLEQGVGAAVRAVRGNPERRAQIATAQAAEELGIDLPQFVAGDASAMRAGSRMEQSPIGGPIIDAARGRLAEQAGEAADNIASVGRSVPEPAMGELAVREARNWRRVTSAAGRKLYTAAQRAADDTRVIARDAMQTLSRLIREEGEVPGGTQAMPILQRYASAFEAGGNITISGARKMRTELRQVLGETMTPGNADRITNEIMDAVGRDIERSLTDAGRRGAAAAYRRADNFWRERMTTINDVLRPIVGRDGENWGADAARALVRDAQGNGDRLAQFLATMPEDAANSIRATLITRLGRANRGEQNAAGDAFSLDTFLSNWNAIRDTRGQIFAPETVRAMNRLALVAERVKLAGRSRNRSNTGSIVAATARGLPAVGGVTASAASSDPTYAAGGILLTIGSALNTRRAARLLASPKFAERLARTPLNANGAAQYWSRPWVENLARTEPSIAADLLEFQESVVDQLTGSTSQGQ